MFYQPSCLFLCFPAGCGSRWCYPLNETRGVSQPTKFHLLSQCALSRATFSLSGNTVGALICHLDFGLNFWIFLVHFWFQVYAASLWAKVKTAPTEADMWPFVYSAILKVLHTCSLNCWIVFRLQHSGNKQAIFTIAQNHFVFQIASGFCLCACSTLVCVHAAA